MPYGARIHLTIERPDPDLVARLAQFSTADLSDAMHGAGTVGRSIQPAYLPMRRIAGPAVTIAVPTGAQSVRKVGFDTAQAGDVIVMNGHGVLHYAMLGGNIGLGLKHRGIAGMVMDGALRDVAAFRDMDLPMFASGVCTLPGPKEGPGEVNVPIACGGVVVNPGDIIVADEDGIVCVPPASAEEVLSAVSRITATFTAMHPELLRGAVTNAEALRTQLRNQGWQVEDEPFAS